MKFFGGLLIFLVGSAAADNQLPDFFKIGPCPTSSSSGISCCSAFAFSDAEGYAAAAASSSAVASACASAMAQACAAANATTQAFALSQAYADACAAADAASKAVSCCSNSSWNEQQSDCDCYSSAVASSQSYAQVFAAALATLEADITALASAISVAYADAYAASNVCASTFTAINATTEAGVRCCSGQRLGGGTVRGGISTNNTSIHMGVATGACPVLSSPKKPKCCFASATSDVTAKGSAAAAACSQVYNDFGAVNSALAAVQTDLAACDSQFKLWQAWAVDAEEAAGKCCQNPGPDGTCCFSNAAANASTSVNAIAAAEAVVSIKVSAVAAAYTAAYAAAFAATSAVASAQSAISAKTVAAAGCCP